MHKIGMRNDIQGLRAIAVLAVIAYHIQGDFLPGGFVGVDLFFVISGFLITSIVLSAKSKGTFSFVSFYLNRARRILPAYLFFVFISSVTFAVLFVPSDYAFFIDSLRSGLFFTSNQYFANFGSYFSPASYELPLLHTWSLSVEMQFYLFLPIFLLVVPKRYLKIAIVIVFCFPYIYWYSSLIQNEGGESEYFSLILRVPEFLIGSWVALIKKSDKQRRRTNNIIAIFSVAGVCGSFIFINDDFLFPGWIALIPCLSIAALIFVRDSCVNDLLRHRVLVWIGGISYSLYLWHWFVLVVTRYYTGSYNIKVEYLPLLLLIIFSISSFSYYFIEKRSLKFCPTKRIFFVFPLVVGLLALAINPLSQLNSLIVPKLPVDKTRYADAKTICHGQIVGDCVRGDREGERILLLGDSHAAQLNIASDEFGRIGKKNIKLITASNCVTIPGFDYERLPKWAWEDCIKQIELVSKLLPEYKKIILVGMWSYQLQSDNFLNALESFILDSKRNNRKVMILAQVPLLKNDMQKQYRFLHLGLPTNTIVDNDYVHANEQLKALATKYENVSFVDLSNSPFFDMVPFYNDELMYFDESHLNEVGARYYGRELVFYINKL